MLRPSVRTASPFAIVSGACLLVASVPTAVWPTPHPGDSYVFDPPPFSGIWIQRIAVPALLVAANVAIAVGLYGLYRRDRDAMSGWHRGSALATVAGVALGAVGTLQVTTADPSAAGAGVIGVVIWLFAALVVVPASIGWGVGYVRADQPTVGVTLAAAPIATGAYVFASLSGLSVEPFGGFAFVAPTVAVAGVVGYELWARATTPLATTPRQKADRDVNS